MVHEHLPIIFLHFCIFNADGSFNENDLPKMLELNCQNDFVFTSRYSFGGASEDDTIVTYLGNQFFSLLGRMFFSLKYRSRLKGIDKEYYFFS